LTAVLTSAFLNGKARGEHVGVHGPGTSLQQPSGLLRAVVHQATGMVGVQLGVSMEESLPRYAGPRLRQRAVEQVAEDVVTRKLRFGDEFDDGSGPHSPDGGKG
jgi:hypothetical protein